MDRRVNRIAGTLLLAVIISACAKNQGTKPEHTLKEAFAGKFFIGTALDVPQIMGQDTASLRVVKNQFNAIVAENCMKSEKLEPTEGVFNFSTADKFVRFGLDNHLFITGHTLIWHSQVPSWFFIDSLGHDVSRDVMIARMKKYIFTVVGHFKGKVKGWDVVNEAIMDDGTYRKSKFFQIIGPEYIKLAFEFAHEADPNAELYYNDYSMANPQKRAGVIKMVKGLRSQGIRIDGIGMQGHIDLIHPDINEFEKSLDAFARLGVHINISELDISVLPNPNLNTGANVSDSFKYEKELNPYTKVLPDSIVKAFNKRYLDFFKLFLKHQDVIERVTLWGVNDAQSWKNNWPIKGRTDYPLLFDRNNNPKPVVKEIIKEAMDYPKTH